MDATCFFFVDGPALEFRPESGVQAFQIGDVPSHEYETE